ncbi:hypothetical protein OIU84_020236 [Salix udensis]|uniref:Mediator of RNA polymerase II transcription subunit 8 n=1 Tax=Salix udensis TaxID=889485 RepID=A0AAD6L335_9ROSI|nr:hypothetical protein OIU84_020236 [Salix udensis]
MAAMEGVMQDQSQLQNQQQQQMVVPERLNHAVQQQLNLESVKTRAIGLFKALTRILEDFDAYARTNTTPKWQDILGQYSMVNLELFSIVDEIKKVSKAFVVHPKNVNAENATILPVMLSSKLLPEMEMDDNSKRELLLQGMQSLPISSQIEKLKARIDMIAAACESAEKVLADTRKAYQFGTRQGPTTLPTLDKAQAAKILEQENLLRAAVNGGEGLRVTGDQRQMTSALPVHLVDVLALSDGMHSFSDSSGMYMKNTPSISNSINNQGSLLQPTGTPLHQQVQQQQQQRQKMMQHQQQQQQLRQSSMQALGQNQMSQMHDLQSQGQQKFQPLHGQHQMQYSQPMGHQQFQSRQLSSGHVQHGMGQSQLNQGNQLNRHLSQFSSAANTSLFNTAQGAPNTQVIPNMSATMSSQPPAPRMQFGLAGNNAQRSHASTVLNDQMYNMGVSNTGGMMHMQQQQQQQQQLGSQGAFGNMQPNAQNLQSSMAALQNASQNHPNFAQQRQQNQQ